MTKMRDSSFGFYGVIPDQSCLNCETDKELALVPYGKSPEHPMRAVLILCSLCRTALKNKELGVHIDVRLKGVDGWM